jgi:hypothetical protein
MGQRVAVDQQDGRAVATITQIDFDFGIAGLNLDLLETFEHGVAPENVLPADANPPSRPALNAGRDMDKRYGQGRLDARLVSVVTRVLRANILALDVAANTPQHSLPPLWLHIIYQ